ncbi:sensor histidine kinase [Bifidobacterium psychraerophilum]|nr:histidine kinase [Bifidobacterium psychraerophilum]MCI1660663.1 histidine kinase [Bifidobacterium psychraerophilum]MCI1804566.1 histidine kinase [Bifidobacterium psychraerophilum]MCI2177107.1 histidine kinase [Bifidobacterium psychraerophilum]
MQGIIRWMDRHMVVVDLLLFMPLSLLSAVIVADTDNAQGLLFAVPAVAQVIWSQIYILPLAMRRRYPQSAALTFVALCMLHMIFGPSLMLTDAVALVMLYSVIVYGDPRNTRAFIALSFVMALLATMAITSSYTIGSLLSPSDDGNSWLGYKSCSTASRSIVTLPCLLDVSDNASAVLILFFVCLICVVIMAFWQRARMYTVRMMKERNASLEARQREEAHIAALAERRRIARDMHDVVAHTLSTIIVQSDAGRYAGSHDIAIAKSTMQTIHHESDTALRDMRRLLGIFEDAGGQSSESVTDSKDSDEESSRSGSEQLAAAPDAAAGNPHFDDALALIQEHDRIPLNPAIVHRIDGTPEPNELSDEASTAAYRVLQESLSNINKYAGRNAKVWVDEQWSSTGLQLNIRDDGLGAKSSEDGHQAGFGLMGMKERVQSLGGSVRSGPLPTGGFEVQAVIPFATRQQDRTTRNSDSPADAALKTRVPAMLQRLRSKPFDQAPSAAGKRFNRIERMSQWSERHYTLIDTMIMLLTIILGIWSTALWTPLITLSDLLPVTESSAPVSAAMVILVTVPPLSFRRRFPQSCAAIIVIASTLQLLCIPDIFIVNMLALFFLHAVILLGPVKRIRWAIVTAFGMCVLLGIKLFVATYWGYPTLILSLFKAPLLNSDSTDSLSASLTFAFVIGLGTMALCGATIASALWTRTKGTNALVLREREEALRQEEEQQRLLATSMERDRIGNAIQHEVTSTLKAVKQKAADGLNTLEQCLDNPDTDNTLDAQESFAAIGKEGRLALAHMRRLLRILRESRSDGDLGTTEGNAAAGGKGSGGDTAGLELSPAPTLEEQLRHISKV